LQEAKAEKKRKETLRKSVHQIFTIFIIRHDV